MRPGHCLARAEGRLMAAITLAILLLSDHSGRDAFMFALVALIIFGIPVTLLLGIAGMVIAIRRRIRR